MKMKISKKIFLIVFAVIVIFCGALVITNSLAKCLKEEKAKIYNVKIHPINKTTFKITWKTDKETFGEVIIENQNKVNEILKKCFHCNLTGNLVIKEGEDIKDALKRYNCSFKVKHNKIFFVHNKNLYDFCTSYTQDKKYISCLIKKDNHFQKTHSVVLDILQPKTEYNLKVRAYFNCKESIDVLTQIYSQQIVKFKEENTNFNASSFGH